MGNLNKIVLAIVVIVLVVVGLFWFVNNQNIQNETGQNPTPTESASPAPTGAADPWERYDYIEPVDWPPVVSSEPGGYECSEAGGVDERAGRTDERTINGRSYCITEVREGAAGSVYSQFAYKWDGMDDTVKIATFSIRQVQCGNYDERGMAECESEQNGFDIDEAIAPTLADLSEQ